MVALPPPAIFSYSGEPPTPTPTWHKRPARAPKTTHRASPSPALLASRVGHSITHRSRRDRESSPKLEERRGEERRRRPTWHGPAAAYVGSDRSAMSGVGSAMPGERGSVGAQGGRGVDVRRTTLREAHRQSSLIPMRERAWTRSSLSLCLCVRESVSRKEKVLMWRREKSVHAGVHGKECMLFLMHFPSFFSSFTS